MQSAFLGTPKQVNCIVMDLRGLRHNVRWLFWQVAGGVDGVLLHLKDQTEVTMEVIGRRCYELIGR